MVVAKKRLVYRTYNLIKGCPLHELAFTEALLKLDAWHHVTLFHQNRELILCLDTEHWAMEMSEAATFPKTYTTSSIGARVNPENPEEATEPFFGEMSALCFFAMPPKPSASMVKRVAMAESFLPHIYLGEKNCALHFFELPPWNDRKIFQQDLVPGANLILDPRVIHDTFSAIITECYSNSSSTSRRAATFRSLDCFSTVRARRSSPILGDSELPCR